MIAPPASQIETLSEGFRMFFARNNPFAKSPGAQIAVLGGFHEGAAKAVAQDTIHVGSNRNADLILLDHDVVEDHFSITLFHSLFGPSAVMQAIGGCVDIGGDHLEVGDVSRHFKLPVEIAVGENVLLCIAVAPRNRAVRSRLERAVTTLWRAVFVVALISAGLLASSMIWADRFVVRSDASAATEGASGAAPVTLPMVEQKLAEMGLDGTLFASELPDGLIQISGRLKAEQGPSWEQVLLWYDSMSHGRPILTGLDATNGRPQMPAITIVRLHEPRELILASGETITPGERIAGDWRLVAIGNDHIEIGLDEDRMIINFAEALK